ncbi:UDP-N-acetylmuramate dehydrogenase [Candidatus Bipolaricaulota bacterium]|nr:UDP-N-acetylmuramate dehydrogenase [Candidatus Bipolaricaulota bacterium]MBS3814233.1 UDP-N-acetylmuramate dehydrogenase [Candidatus Bipolaricaulota bacterium]MBS3825379.1 UDP-N-acetylmuramate dehydrogenase [Candidatus Bipolaricaulota bacterium]
MVPQVAEKPKIDLIQEDVSLRSFTTWHVGGPARFFCQPKSTGQVKRAINFANEMGLDIKIIGNGSNLLVPDEGYDGLVIRLGSNLAETEINDRSINAAAGASLYKLADITNKAGSSCFNFLTGIPGTVGGGITMNAGAYGREISNYLKGVKYIDGQGEIHEYSHLPGSFDYRNSPFLDSEKIIVGAELKLDYTEDQPKMSEILESRRKKLPYSKPSAGSVFKNPTNCDKTAGELLDRAGAKGLTVGDAVVSHQHANFILNKGHATAKNIQNTIDILRNRVYKEFGVTLVTEVVVI